MNASKLYLGELQCTVTDDFASAKKNMEECLPDRRYDRVRAALSLVKMYDRLLNPDIFSKKSLEEDGEQQEFKDGSVQQFKQAKDKYLNMGLEFLKIKPEVYWYDYDFISLGKIYWYFERYDESEKACKEALKKRESVDAYLGLGETYLSQKKYQKALKSFKEAERLDRCDFSIRTKIAEVHTLLAEYDLAEKKYKEIIKDLESQGQKNVDIDALIGLGNIYRDKGDNAYEIKNVDEAKKWYNKAKFFYEPVLMAASDRATCSRPLKIKEQDSIVYSLGRICFYSSDKQEERSSLIKTYFIRIDKTSNEYDRAQDAIEKINKLAQERKIISQVVEKWKMIAVSGVAALLFLLALYSVTSMPNIYVIDKDKFFEALADTSDDTKNLAVKNLHINWLEHDNSVKLSQFMEARLDSLDIKYNPQKLNASIQTAWKSYKPKVDFNSIGTLGLILFAVILMVLGLYIDDLTKLKFSTKIGSIELEKPTSTIVSATTPQNISLNK